ncbi:MAG: HAD-IB family hydrolase [Brevinema sp.]
MLRFSLYDFDKTIYSKDTGVEILKHIFLHKPLSIIFLPQIFLALLAYGCRLITKDRIKEIVFSPITLFHKKEWKLFISQFWHKESSFLFPMVLQQIQKDQQEGYHIGIISASAEEFLFPIGKKLAVDFIIGTRFQDSSKHMSSKIFGKNCKNQEKVHRLYEYIEKHYPNQAYTISKMYSDSLHDLPLLQIAEHPFTIEKNGNIREGFPKPNNNL